MNKSTLVFCIILWSLMIIVSICLFVFIWVLDFGDLTDKIIFTIYNFLLFVFWINMIIALIKIYKSVKLKNLAQTFGERPKT